ncbi:MAG: MATE family efflux transporter [Oscillospiraceae bacterium]|nr:MATE family efflux transporter [Oscillospiraceae bacterium]MBQ4312166.1 MATE family efflux transporter [Oscillospiraceae bacterium]
MKNTYDLTEGKPSKLILRFFFPMFFTNMLQQFYNFADTIIVGKGLGDDKLAAVGNMSSLCFLIMGFSMGLTSGFSVIIGQNYGAKDEKALKRSVASAVTLSGMIAVLLTTVSIVFLRPLLMLLNTSETILDDSLTYGYILFAGLFATISYNLCGSILRALGDSKTPFIAIIASSVVNISANLFTIYVMHTGVEGPAYATILSQFLSALICFMKLRKIDAIKLSRSDFAFSENTGMYTLLVRNGVPMAVMNSITAVGCMVVQSFVNDMGVVYTAAYSACSKYLNVFMQPASTAGLTMSAYTGQNYGANRKDRIIAGTKVCLAIAVTSYVIYGSVMFFFPSQLAALMLNGSSQIAYAAGFIRRTGIFIFTVDIMFVLRTGCQGMGRPLLPMLSGILEMILRISVIVIFSKLIGFNATAYAEVAAWTGALLVNAGAFFHALKLMDSAGQRRITMTAAAKSKAV